MKMDRLISIIMILLERKRVTISELAKVCEVTTRTIQRDLDAINQAGVPIVSYPGVGGGVGIMENYKLEKRLFSTADVTALLMGLSSIHSSLSGGEIVGALAKIKGMIPEEQRASIEVKAGRFAIDTSSWNGIRPDSEIVRLLGVAMEENRLVQFSYRNFKLDKSTRTVEPYRLLLKAMKWYFEGFCLARQDYRIFKLSRMSSVVVADKMFKPRSFIPQPILQPAFHNEQDALPAILRIREAALDRIMDEYGSDCIEAESADTWIVRIPLFNNEWGYKFLLQFGTDCECLEPKCLRDNFIQYVAQLASIYMKQVG